MAKAFAALIFGLCFAFSAFAATAEKKQPDWSQLTPEQQQILAPLSNEWGKFDDRHRKKWLLVAKRYPQLKPDEQQRLQTQMKDWATLTPEQRRQARENYKKLAKQPPEKREVVKQKWQEGQQQAPLKGAPPAPAAASGDKALPPPAPADPSGDKALPPPATAAPSGDKALPPPATAAPSGDKAAPPPPAPSGQTR